MTVVLPDFSVTVGIFSSKIYVLVVSKVLSPFVNTLTPDDKYSLDNRKIWEQPIQIQLSRELKFFSQFVNHFWSLHLIWNISKKKKSSLIAYVFGIL